VGGIELAAHVVQPHPADRSDHLWSQGFRACRNAHRKLIGRLPPANLLEAVKTNNAKVVWIECGDTANVGRTLEFEAGALTSPLMEKKTELFIP
jgi:hypothetical protein